MLIDLAYEPNVDRAPSGFRTALQQAANFLDSLFITPITLTIQVGFGTIDNAPLGPGYLGEATAGGDYLSYSNLVSDLRNVATSPTDTTFLAGLPATLPYAGTFYVANAEEKALGIAPTAPRPFDGFVGFSSTAAFDYNAADGISPGTTDFMGVALHELTHVMGRLGVGLSGIPSAMNLMMYGANGQIDTSTANARTLSLNGGQTTLATFDTAFDPADLASPTPDPFDAHFNPNEVYAWTPLDSQIMDALGYTLATQPNTPSPNNEVIRQGGTITDANLNTWTILNGQIQVNGVTDPTTANVVQLDYVNGTIWQENTSGAWYYKASPSDAWSAPQNQSPILPPTIAGTVADQPIAAGGTLMPFSNVTIAAQIADANDTLTIAQTDASGNVTDAAGQLSGPNLTEVATGRYRFSVTTPTALNAALRQVVFTPSDAAPASPVTAGFQLTLTDSTASILSGAITSDSTTSIVEQPAITGLTAFDTTTNTTMAVTPQPYSGPVKGLTSEFVTATSDNIDLSVTTPNWFLHSGSGEDALQVSSGTNVMDGGTGSNFLVGGTGTDTFFVDDRGAPADIWSTMVNFHSGDVATVFGIAPTGFNLSWADNQGAATATGLTLTATATGQHNASLTLAGYTTSDLRNGRLIVAFGTEPDGSGHYMNIRAP